MIIRGCTRDGDLPAAQSVMVDASVLMSLLILKRADILGRLPGYRFVITESAYAEGIRSDHRIGLKKAVADGFLERWVTPDPRELRVFADLLSTLGVGEAASLAAAECQGWFLASDEQGLFRRIALRRIGGDRILTTATILAEAMTAGVLTQEELGEAKLALKRHRPTSSADTFRFAVSGSGVEPA